MTSTRSSERIAHHTRVVKMNKCFLKKLVVLEAKFSVENKMMVIIILPKKKKAITIAIIA